MDTGLPENHKELEAHSETILSVQKADSHSKMNSMEDKDIPHIFSKGISLCM